MKRNIIIFFDESDFAKIGDMQKTLLQDSTLIHIDIYDAKYMSKGENRALQENVSLLIQENFFSFEKIRSNNLQKTIIGILDRNFENIYLPKDDKRKVLKEVEKFNELSQKIVLY